MDIVALIDSLLPCLIAAALQTDRPHRPLQRMIHHLTTAHLLARIPQGATYPAFSTSLPYTSAGAARLWYLCCRPSTYPPTPTFTFRLGHSCVGLVQSGTAAPSTSVRSAVCARCGTYSRAEAIAMAHNAHGITAVRTIPHVTASVRPLTNSPT